jgi:formylglycine-generating enzyme
MKNFKYAFSFLCLVIFYSCSKKEKSDFVLVEGGQLVSKDSLTSTMKIIVPDFYIGTTEVTQKEWNKIMGKNSSEFVGEEFPVTNVSWYDCVAYCNKKSELEGLKPYYEIDKMSVDPVVEDTEDTLKWTVKQNKLSNGYRLPTVYEWEYAASGGKLSKNYIYSGSNNIKEVAWFWVNSGKEELGLPWVYEKLQGNGCKSHPVSQKKPNELGLFDMSGNVREWCWEYKNNGELNAGRSLKGGCWMGAEYVCEPKFTGYSPAVVAYNDLGFRIARNK